MLFIGQGIYSPAYRTSLKPEGLIEVAVSQKFFILKYVSCLSVSMDPSFIKNNGAFTEVEHHVQVVSGNYF